MGEVYRADDLELGQSVALKFLPPRVAADPSWLNRFRNEVRTAREIAHPNVCRIYDIAEQDGHVFLSMEYIDGEDLAGVLRRLGRPSREKAVEIARQICLGLAAAHENKVLHRDLKPANIMIDGRGRVRITDFGLAGFLDELQKTESRAGTPAYMAPEQLTDGKVSVRSDIYSLGLIFYELFTGKRVFDTNDVEELKRKHTSGTVSTPSSVMEEIDPAVERVILRCLEQEPEHRPQSVYQILAALPGGDPLAAALAAGETPSPELVARAGQQGGLSGRVVAGLTIWIAAVVLFHVITSARWQKAPRESGVMLSMRAGEIIRALGYEDLPPHTAWGFEENTEYLRALNNAGDTSWSGLNRTRPSAILFWRRWSPSPLSAIVDLHQPFPLRSDPPQAAAGSITVVLDDVGRLVSLDVESDPKVTPAARGDGYWDVLLERAGLPDAEQVEAKVQQSSPTHSDDVRVWTVRTAEEDEGELVAVAGGFRGRPVSFRMKWGWGSEEAPAARGNVSISSTAPPVRPPRAVSGSLYVEGSEASTTTPTGPRSGPRALPQEWSVFSGTTSTVGKVLGVAGDLLWPMILMVSAVLAIRNVRAGRGDRAGAMRAGLLMFGLYLLAGVANIRFAEVGLTGALGQLSTGPVLGHALIHGFQIWLCYLAMEPYVRRIWPRMLVAWVRLMSGRWRDPLVGREVLIGLSLGMLIYLGMTLVDAAAKWLGFLNFAPIPGFYALTGIASPGRQVYSLCLVMTSALLQVMSVLVLLLVFRIVTGRTWAALLIVVALYTIGTRSWYFGVAYAREALILTSVLWAFLYAVVIGLCLMRFGLVCALSAHIGSTLVSWLVPTMDSQDWYAAPMAVQLIVLGALVGYGSWLSLAGQPLFKDLLAKPQANA
jgi:serine/threonine-protein kinase